MSRKLFVKSLFRCYCANDPKNNPRITTGRGLKALIFRIYVAILLAGFIFYGIFLRLGGG